MQHWVFDRDGARTSAAPPPPGATAAPVAAAPRSRGLLRRRGRWALTAGLAAVVIATGAAVAAGASDEPATASSTAGSTQVVPQQADPGQGSGLLPPERGAATEQAPPGAQEQTRPGAPAGDEWTGYHEERELTGPDGTTRTVALQGGEITAVDEGSVTVASSDGYERTYAVTAETRIATPSGTLTDLAVGDVVLVQAVVDGDTATATAVSAPPADDGQPGGDAPAAPDTGTGTGDTTDLDA